MEVALLTFSMILLTLLSGLSSASEIAFFSLSSMRIKAYQTDRDPRRRLIAALVLHPQQLFVTLFMVNITVNILLQNSASKLFAGYGWLLQVGLPLILALMLGEIIPKYIALNNNARIAYRMAPIVDFVARWLRPLRNLILRITSPISHVMFFFLRREEEVSQEEMHLLLRQSEESGVLDPDEAQLVKGYLYLRECQVKELMRPREDVLYYDRNDPITQLYDLFLNQKVSRVPICTGSLQTVLGILTVNKFFQHQEHIQDVNDLQPWLCKPFYVPETTPARTLMSQFDQRNEVFAMVVDEYGSVVGIITREDLVERVIGEINDSRDVKAKYTRAGDEVIIASGKLELMEFEEVFGLALNSPSNMVTLGGWLTETLGTIPKSGTKYQTDDFLFQILASDPNRIRRVYIRRLQPNETPEANKAEEQK